MQIDWHAVISYSLWLGLILILGVTPIAGVKGI
jgi:hypothetical protein